MDSPQRVSRSVLALLGCALLALLAAPALASAASTFEVDTTVDAPDTATGNGICEITGGGGCSLRAAVEEANADGPGNTIVFDPQVFDGGDSTSNIQLSGGQLAIEEPMTIEGDSGGQCVTGTPTHVKGPCVGVEGEFVFYVNDSDVTISGLAIVAEGGVGFNVANAPDFVARDNWIGISLEGNTAVSSPIGMIVNTKADDAQIGGATAAARNVFGASIYGLIVRGAEGTTIEGNYFGLEPDGTTMRANGNDLTVGDEAGALDGKASDTAITGNLFASKTGAESSIALLGSGSMVEEPASGPTTVQGNRFGLDAAGTPTGEAASAAIRLGTAGAVTIGGPKAAQANRINGEGGAAILAGTAGTAAAKGLVVEGNSIGRNATDTAPLAPPKLGIQVLSPGLTAGADQALVAGNSIAAEEVGIEAVDSGARILGNRIEGAGEGIRTAGSTTAPNLPNLIEANAVAKAGDAGIVVENSGNSILGNTVAAEDTGIAIAAPDALHPAGGNKIGGETEASENAITVAAGWAIEIHSTATSRNEVARNRGAGTGTALEHAFIRLSSFGSEPDPNEIKAPTVTAAAKTEASGKGVAGATVRVFRKASAEPGEIAGYLGKATVEPDGTWTATYAAVPTGTIVAATQTKEGGTSELGANAVTPPDPTPPMPPTPTCETDPALCPSSEPGPEPSLGAASASTGPSAAATPSPSPAPPVDTKKPKLTITAGPKTSSSATTATFRFKSDEAGSSFRCKLDDKGFTACKSPRTYKHLTLGMHVFKVKAKDRAGNVSAVASRTFVVTG